MIYDTIQHTNELGIKNSAARVLPAHTVCLSRTASVGYVVVMGRSMATSQDFVNWICSPSIEWRFLKYVLLAEGESLLRFASGTTHQTIYFPEVKAFHVCLPPANEQQRIVGVLGALEDKIESNRRLAAVLDETTRALFQARFVAWNSADAIENSDIGPVPRRWRAGALTDLAEFVNGKAFTKYANGCGRPIIRIRELNDGVDYGTPRSDIEAADEYIARFDDTLFAWSGSLGVHRWPGEESLINQHIFKVIPKGWPAWFVFAWIEEHMERFRAIARDKATTMGHIQRRHLDEARLPLPTVEAITEADAVVGPLDQQRASLVRESHTLGCVRDALLPRLISGRIRVPDSADPAEVIEPAAQALAAAS